MICEQCSNKEAKVHLTQVVDGAVKKLHLCDQCATASGFDMKGPVSITDILLGMGGEEALTPTPETTERVCPTCQMRKVDFKKTGRLGCPDCYEAFSDELSSLVKALHRSDQHLGKVPEREGVKVRVSAEMARLKKALSEAVNKENFEKAAKLRDEIQTCRDALEKDRKSNAS